jgi:hypothetical protein
MRKWPVLVILLTVLFGFSNLASSGEIHGNTFVSTKFKGLKISTPSVWEIIDTENNPPDGAILPICRLKRKESLNDKKPEGEFMAAKVGSYSLDELVKVTVANWKKAGFEITKYEQIKINGKNAYEVHFILTHAGTSAMNRAYFMSGSNYYYELLIYDDDSVFDEELSQIVNSIEYK